jgi:D-alanyl-D-alanine carboxypeptidase
MRKKQKPIFAVFVIAFGSFAVVSLIYHAVDKKNYSEIDTAFASAITPESIHICSSGDSYTCIPPTPEIDALNWGFQGSNSSYNEADDTVFIPASELDTDPASITVFVNKEYSLPQDYVPSALVEPDIAFSPSSYGEQKLMRPEAAFALEDLINAAKADGYTIYGVSAYRSYNRQLKIFTNNIINKGKEHTLKYSAVPGTSEHQTGLAIDLSTPSLSGQLVPSFAHTPEGIWLKNNAYKFGFIIRYPKDKMDLTGYEYEPWHIRYVDQKLANYLQENDLTLDEYYHYTPSKNFNFEEVYADLINYKVPASKPKAAKKKINPTPTPTPTPTVSPTVIPSKAAENTTPGEEENTQTQPFDEQDHPPVSPAPTLLPTIPPAPDQDFNSSNDKVATDSSNNDNVQDTSEYNPHSMNTLSTDTPVVNETNPNTP